LEQVQNYQILVYFFTLPHKTKLSSVFSYWNKIVDTKAVPDCSSYRDLDNYTLSGLDLAIQVSKWLRKSASTFSYRNRKFSWIARLFTQLASPSEIPKSMLIIKTKFYLVVQQGVVQYIRQPRVVD
jgi:hypothetical protein